MDYRFNYYSGRHDPVKEISQVYNLKVTIGIITLNSRMLVTDGVSTPIETTKGSINIRRNFKIYTKNNINILGLEHFITGEMQ